MFVNYHSVTCTKRTLVFIQFFHMKMLKISGDVTLKVDPLYRSPSLFSVFKMLSDTFLDE